MLLYNQVKREQTKQRVLTKTAPYNTIESKKEDKYSDTIAEKKIEKEVP